jgi:hypothetical protein
VQLHVAGEVAFLAHGFAQPLDIPADDADALANRLPGPRDLFEIRRRDVPDGAPASDRATLFVRPDDDLERMAETNVLLAQRSSDFDRAERTEGSIEVAPVGDGIDVRADEDRLEGTVGAVESSDDVPRRIDARVEPCVAE